MTLEERKFIKALSDRVKAGHPLSPGELSKAVALLIDLAMRDMAED